jgi:riboflavin kinase/FMN adenylyltransferase
MHDFFYGTVIRGRGKGKEFGFPTINIKLNNNELYIENGVYAVVINIDNQLYKGMLYAGTRPTLGMQELSVEIHVFEFDKNIYHKQISFQMMHKMREEITFSNIHNLIEQLRKDKEVVNHFFRNDT